jgi:predicted NAD-dependent protein-ADP-ribosyltransferase YbiA (DUF1768 family)
MVYSSINGAVFYKEISTIDQEDSGHKATLYEMDAHGKRILVVFGKAKHQFIQRNIVFFPIYLVVHHKVQAQIGVVEMPKDRVLEIVEEDGELDVSKLAPPLLYGFVNDTFIDRSGSDAELFLKTQDRMEKEAAESKSDKPDVVESKEEPAAEYDENDDVLKVRVAPSQLSKESEKARETLKEGVFEFDKTVKPPASLKEETEEDTLHDKQAFKSTAHTTWIEKFMKNNHYDIHEVENNGDCLFAVIRDAFKQMGQITTVAKLRAILAKDATEDIFQEHRTLYLDLDGTVREYDKELKGLKHSVEHDLNKRAEKARDDKVALSKILSETNRLKGEYKRVLQDRRDVQAIINENVGNFAAIDTLEKFREYVQTPAFWADSWAISTLERALRIKFIILSQRAYLDGDLDGVMNCGEIDPEIQREGTFHPKHYILTTFSGDHYRLVTYKNKRIFDFHEIPYHIKALIMNKCLERSSGAFYVIPEFRKLKARMGIDEDEGAPVEEADIRTDEYDPKIVFEFHASSAKTAKPGKGANEKIPADKRALFTDLGRIENWRRKLDDYWTEAPFELHGKKWASVEHYYQAAKFRKHNSDFAAIFSLDSDSEISKDVDLAKAAGSKSGKAVGKAKSKINGDVLLRPKGVEIDPDFYGQRSEQERIDAVRAKFTKNEDLRQLIIATRDAKLMHYNRGAPADIDHVIMSVRKELLSKIA